MNLPRRVQSIEGTIPPPTHPSRVPSNISFKLFLPSLSLTTSLAFFLVFFSFFFNSLSFSHLIGYSGSIYSYGNWLWFRCCSASSVYTIIASNNPVLTHSVHDMPLSSRNWFRGCIINVILRIYWEFWDTGDLSFPLLDNGEYV